MYHRLWHQKIAVFRSKQASYYDQKRGIDIEIKPDKMTLGIAPVERGFIYK
jgi:hypothetical protein